MLPLKIDAGSGALEQMVLGEFCPRHFDAHVPALTRALRTKLETLMEALNEQFGTTAEFEDPKGGIFLWVKLPDQVDTQKLFTPALAAGVAINPGAEWTTDKNHGRSRARLGSLLSPKCAGANSACRHGLLMWSGRRHSARRKLNAPAGPAARRISR